MFIYEINNTRGITEMNIENWEKELYDEIFGNTFDTIIEDYNAGKITKKEIEINIVEQQQTLMNGFYEGSKTFNSGTAMIDAHQLALAKINKASL